ncbi:hypothetical protein [Rufibacter tibetensis]|uniref:Uncharacterized protein n=1 Tax=Rufibacter tibetensis TaxID=512763 RepID=A0A0P0CXJ4_9BACT|nr:hypothetical protein [Rufibacter tibetensis]ALI99119.1 hypothetical protein DC20_09200 [Rufibacter tibetensis]
MEIAILIMLLVVPVCFMLTIVFLLSYLVKRNKSRLKNAAISFAIGVVGPILLIVIEEVFFSYNISDKEEVLVASREASIGGILLKLYADSTFETGGFRQVTSAGKFSLSKDTLFIVSANKTEAGEEFTKRSFLIKDGHLEETTDTGVGYLEIHENTLK